MKSILEFQTHCINLLILYKHKLKTVYLNSNSERIIKWIKTKFYPFRNDLYRRYLNFKLHLHHLYVDAVPLTSMYFSEILAISEKRQKKFRVYIKREINWQSSGKCFHIANSHFFIQDKVKNCSGSTVMFRDMWRNQLFLLTFSKLYVYLHTYSTQFCSLTRHKDL